MLTEVGDNVTSLHTTAAVVPVPFPIDHNSAREKFTFRRRKWPLLLLGHGLSSPDLSALFESAKRLSISRPLPAMAESLEYAEKNMLLINLISLKCSRNTGFRCQCIGTGGELLIARISKLIPAPQALPTQPLGDIPARSSLVSFVLILFLSPRSFSELSER
jgi:hypothetical protein